jgi:hypothetical protein
MAITTDDRPLPLPPVAARAVFLRFMYFIRPPVLFVIWWW